MRLNHVALSVSDREVSAAFYARWFAFSKRLHEDEHLLILADPSGGLLALSLGDPPPEQPRTTHFGSQLEKPDDVRALRAALSAAGVQEAEYQDKGPTRVQVFDPDGYRVEAYAF